jgi:hypothetical protein
MAKEIRMKETRVGEDRVIILRCGVCNDELKECYGCGKEFKVNDVIYCRNHTGCPDTDQKGYCASKDLDQKAWEEFISRETIKRWKHYCEKCKATRETNETGG